MIVGAAALRPMVQPLAFQDWQKIDAGEAPLHQAMSVEFPQFVALAAKPGTVGGTPCRRKAYRHAGFAKAPQLLDQAIVVLFPPFAGQECDDRGAAPEEFRSVLPDAVFRVSQGDAGGIAAVPHILCRPYFLRGGLRREGRQRWAAFHGGPFRLRPKPWGNRYRSPPHC